MWISWTEKKGTQTEVVRDLWKQVSSLVFGEGGSFEGDYALSETERLCLPMESPLGRTRSMVGK